VEEMCKVLNELLQGATEAQGGKKELFNPYSGNLKVIEKIRRADVFAQFERYKDKFKAKPWQTIVLYYQMELNQEQIAKKLGIVRSAVSNRLKRARDKKDKLDKDRRREAYEHLQKKGKYNDESCIQT
jgi:RNA polymerase sigma factor (sigma-70 family)